jgi:hypothetical protein
MVRLEEREGNGKIGSERREWEDWKGKKGMERLEGIEGNGKIGTKGNGKINWERN